MSTQSPIFGRYARGKALEGMMFVTSIAYKL